MNPNEGPILRSSLLLPLVTLAVCLLNAGIAESTSSRPTVPDRRSLKARVNQFHQAYQDRSEEGLLALVLPQLVRCETSEEGPFSWWDEKSPQLLSWKIRSIRYDDSSLEEGLCSGEQLHATAGAI